MGSTAVTRHGYDRFHLMLVPLHAEFICHSSQNSLCFWGTAAALPFFKVMMDSANRPILPDFTMPPITPGFGGRLPGILGTTTVGAPS